MAIFDLLFTAAEVALVALSIATMTVVALGGLIVLWPQAARRPQGGYAAVLEPEHDRGARATV